MTGGSIDTGIGSYPCGGTSVKYRPLQILFFFLSLANKFKTTIPTNATYTQSQKKRNFSSWIFPGAQGQGHMTLDHGKSATPDTLVYTLFQKKGNFQNVAFLLRKSVLSMR